MLCAPFASPGTCRFLGQKRLFNFHSFPTIISREHYATVEEKADRVALQGTLLPVPAGKPWEQAVKIPSSKTFMLLGFAISLVSMVLNTFVLANIDTRLKAAENEYFQLVESLSKQAADLNATDARFDLYKILHYVAYSVPIAKAQDARKDAELLLKGILTKYYATANDISPVEVTRIEVEEMSEVLQKLEQTRELLQALQQSPDQSARAQLAAALETLGEIESPPKSALAQKLREVGQYAAVELSAENELEILLKLTPLAKSLREQILASINKKESRIHELERIRAALARQSKYATYAAISLQMFGLMLIFTKDLAGEMLSE